MSLRYKGAVISATPPTTTGGMSGTAPGAWTLQQQMQAQAAGTWPSFVPLYIEDVFSTYLYTGNSSTQTITNGIDLAGKGGLTWAKFRSTSGPHYLFDTDRGGNKPLSTNSTSAQGATNSTDFTGFTNSGFTLGFVGNDINNINNTYASWTFREQPKFFDVVTYTGNGANRTIAHSLGSVPGCIIVKRTDTTADWQVYHRSLANTEYMVLNTSDPKATGTTRWNSTTPTSTVFSLGTDTTVNANGGTYVAYVFAHNAGGFGLSGTDNVISCGSYVASGAGTSINLGYEAQWVMVKSATAAGGWYILDNMRGMGLTGYLGFLDAASTAAEQGYGSTPALSASATGFIDNGVFGTDGRTIVYIAIRRGPMKTPTSGTSVFGLNARTGTGANATVTGSAGVSDAVLIKNRGSAVGDLFASRLTGTGYLETSSTAAEVAAGTTILQANPWDVMDGVKVGTTSTITNASSNTYINYLFDRAPGFFDVVCYTGGTQGLTVNHNLGVVPQLIIVKARVGTYAGTAGWTVYSATLGNTGYLILNSTQASGSDSGSFWNNTTPTSTTFTVGLSDNTNNSSSKYVAYLFASCPGVSKVGSYTGNGTTLQVNCGFTAGSRFVMIKRTDSTGDWYVWDSARGIVAGNDPYLLLNSTAAEVTNTDYVDTYSAGFEISSTAPAAINANGGTFIFLAIA